jgi:hypothetical protein
MALAFLLSTGRRWMVGLDLAAGIALFDVGVEYCVGGLGL